MDDAQRFIYDVLVPKKSQAFFIELPKNYIELYAKSYGGYDIISFFTHKESISSQKAIWRANQIGDAIEKLCLRKIPIF